MPKREKIEPNIYVTLDIHAIYKIPIIVRDKDHNILEMTYEIQHVKDYDTRYHILNSLDTLYKKYNFDTIIFEQNQLFIDKIDRHPDPLVMRNIILGYGLKTSIDDKYHHLIKYILELPEYEWRRTILNPSVKYSIDLYKSHILEQSFTDEQLQIIDDNNYYKALCLSESIWFDKLMDKRYQINKGD